MKIDDIALVKYTSAEEKLNVITHVFGLIIPLLVMIQCFPRALSTGNVFYIICSLLYAGGTALMFCASAFYHGSPEGSRIKKISRLIDHSMVFIAIAGTVSGCVPIVFFQGFKINAVMMLIVSWGCVIAGLCLTCAAFGKHKVLQMCLYIGCAVVCAALGGKSYFHLPLGAFLCFLFGSLTLIVACVLFKIGATKKYFHSVFHVFIVVGLAIYYIGIYKYVFCLIK